MTHEMAVMDISGDLKIIWSEDNEDEVEAAREQFDKLKKKGFAAFSVKKGGEKGEIVTKFDASIEKLIMVPGLAGG